MEKTNENENKAIIELKPYKFTISINNYKEKIRKEIVSYPRTYCKYNLHVKINNLDNNAFIYSFDFKYSNSVIRYEKNQAILELNDYINALACYINDAMSYYHTFNIDDFASEFGLFDNKISKTIKAFNMCKNAFDTLKRIYNKNEFTIIHDELIKRIEG
nr:MAG: hypothetical protein [uncultured archaeon]